MDKTTITKWLDKQIAARKKLAQIEILDDDVCAANGLDEYHVHIYKGIELIAKCLGVELKVYDDGTDTYPIRKYFMYKNNIQVFELSDREGVSDNES